MTDHVYRMDGAVDPTTVNTTGTAAAAITSTPPGFAVTATSSGAGADMSLVGSSTFKRSGLTALRITTANPVTNIIRLPFHTTGGGRQVAVEFYHGATALPGSNIAIAKIQTAADSGPRIAIETDGKVSLQDAAGVTQAQTVAGAWAINRRNRIALVLDNTGGAAAGTATLHVYNDDGLTPTGTAGPVTGKNFAAAALTNMDIGSPTGTGIAWVEWFEDVQMGNGRTTEFGPYSLNLAPTASAGPDQTVAPYATVTLDSSGSTDPDGTIASRAWTHISGPLTTAALSSTTTTAPTYTAPGTLAGDTDVWRVTVTDNNGATSSDDVAITYPAVAERAIIGGAQVPMKIVAI